MDWKIAAQFGVPFLILCAIGLFLWKGLWPFLTEQFDRVQGARTEDQRIFLAQLDKRDAVTQKQTEAIERLTEELRHKR